MKTQRFTVSVLFMCLISLALVPGRLRPVVARPPQNSMVVQALVFDYTPVAALPGALLFIENVGQYDTRARFQVLGGDRTIWLAENALWVTVWEPIDKEVRGHRDKEVIALSTSYPVSPSPHKGLHLKLSFVGANPHPRLKPFHRLDTVVSYFVGNDPAKWRSNVPVWGGVRYEGLYPGIDLVITSGHSHWTWHLVQETNCQFALQDVQLQVDGAETLAVDGADSLLGRSYIRLTTSVGEFSLPLPSVITQDGSPILMPGIQPRVRGNIVTFPFCSPYASLSASSAAASDLAYSTFLGGAGVDLGYAIAIDGVGNTYVAGSTNSPDFPTTPGAFDPNGGFSIDAFVAKVNADGTRLVYAIILGGSLIDRAFGIAVDGDSNAYVTGGTVSSDFPTTAGAFSTSYNGGYVDGFVTKVNANGTGLLYSTFLGGEGGDESNAITVDMAGSAYVAGGTGSTNFPTTAGAFDTSNNGNGDIFVVKINADGSSLIYGTFLGGRGLDVGNAIAVDEAGSTYVTGGTDSVDFPTTAETFDNSYNFRFDAFVAKINANGTGLVYATFLGGALEDRGHGIAVDGDSNAYVTGRTVSSNFPTTAGAFDTSYNGDYDAFVVKVNTSGTGLAYASFLGGSRRDAGSAITVDGAGNAYVTGNTESQDFPTTAGVFDASHNGSWDAFVVEVNAAGTELAYATFLGGSEYDEGLALALGGAGHAYVSGHTASPGFPTTMGTFDTSYNGNGDAFVTRWIVPTPKPMLARMYLPLMMKNHQR